MEIKSTQDQTVYKCIHDDHSETAIKDVGGCSGLSADASKKYSIFASCSYGCKLACKFCMLHTKGCKYQMLTPTAVETNIYSAVHHVAKLRPSITQKNVKLAWMGMGESSYEYDVLFRSGAILQRILTNGYASGIDCIDIGTAFPSQRDILVYYAMWTYLHEELEKRQLSGRDPLVRFFISWGSANSSVRNFLMGSGTITQRIDKLRQYITTPGSLICHLVLLNEVNDSPEEIDAILRYFSNRPDLELRLLRYNQCSGSPFEESSRFDEIAASFLKRLPRVKVQTSPGSEIMAACGQFLLGSFASGSCHV